MLLLLRQVESMIRLLVDGRAEAKATERGSGIPAS